LCAHPSSRCVLMVSPSPRYRFGQILSKSTIGISIVGTNRDFPPYYWSLPGVSLILQSREL
jgi:hypothetical protein